MSCLLVWSNTFSSTIASHHNDLFSVTTWLFAISHNLFERPIRVVTPKLGLNNSWKRQKQEARSIVTSLLKSIDMLQCWNKVNYTKMKEICGVFHRIRRLLFSFSFSFFAILLWLTENEEHKTMSTPKTMPFFFLDLRSYWNHLHKKTFLFMHKSEFESLKVFFFYLASDLVIYHMICHKAVPWGCTWWGRSSL